MYGSISIYVLYVAKSGGKIAIFWAFFDKIMVYVIIESQSL